MATNQAGGPIDSTQAIPEYGTTTSTGHALSAASWLNTHYLAGQPEYEALLRRAGFQPGWSVLDAGCGSGSYLPFLAELLKPDGRISAIDLVPEHITRVSALIAAGDLACPVDTRVGDITALPYAERVFDGVWSANVTQYLPDATLHAMLAEARRTLKPGGLLAIKDTEDSALCLHPIPPLLLWRLLDALAWQGEMTVIGGLRSLHLTRFVQAAGFVDVRRTITTIERESPLRPVEARLIAELVDWLAYKATGLDLPADDQVRWRACTEPSGPDYILAQPDLYWREAAILVTGYAPT